MASNKNMSSQVPASLHATAPAHSCQHMPAPTHTHARTLVLASVYWCWHVCVGTGVCVVDAAMCVGAGMRVLVLARVGAGMCWCWHVCVVDASMCVGAGMSLLVLTCVGACMCWCWHVCVGAGICVC